MPFMNQRKGKKESRKYFMIKSPRKNVADSAVGVGGRGDGGRGKRRQPPAHQSDPHTTEPLRQRERERERDRQAER